MFNWLIGIHNTCTAYAFFHTYILPKHHLAKPSSSSLYQEKTRLDGIDWYEVISVSPNKTKKL